MLDFTMSCNVPMFYSHCLFKKAFVNLFISYFFLSHLTCTRDSFLFNLSWDGFSIIEFKLVQTDLKKKKKQSWFAVCGYGFVDLCWVLIFTLNYTFYLLLLKMLANTPTWSNINPNEQLTSSLTNWLFKVSAAFFIKH